MSLQPTTANTRLTSDSLESGHKRSTGCNSGEWEGQKSRCSPSGIARRELFCQPARSSIRAIYLSDLRWRSWAKAEKLECSTNLLFIKRTMASVLIINLHH